MPAADANLVSLPQQSSVAPETGGRITANVERITVCGTRPDKEEVHEIGLGIWPGDREGAQSPLWELEF